LTGCGNTVNTNHPVVRRMIVDALAYWSDEVGVDGFRFDLAAVFFRGLAGERLERSPIADEIAADPRLAGSLLVAEPWDITGFAPEHGFPPPWRQWNGAFRDTVRRYARGDEVPARTLALRLSGAPDRGPARAPAGGASTTIDFVACHDGFTLADLVAYETKHNEENGEGNRDGTSFNLSSNHGVEGPTEDVAIARLRSRQVRNLLVLAALTRGTPLLLAGDEMGRTQRGNNNAWCQDNAIGWIDWSTADEGLHELVRRLFALRRELAGLRLDRSAELAPFGSPGSGPESGAARAALLLFRSESDDAPELALALNPTAERVRLPLPRAAAERAWALLIDTRHEGAAAVPPPTERPRLAASTAELELPPKSLRLLLALD
jgi:glycogen operon protein